MLIAHLSDSHIRDAADVRAFEHQLDRIAARGPDHLVVSGDLLDRWSPQLLSLCLDALAARGLLGAGRTTIIHGNHDLASSGGHPRGGADLARLVLRAWDFPPVIARRRRRFYAAIESRAPGVAPPAPFAKDLGEMSLAVLDSVSVPWTPVRWRGGLVQTRHAIGRIRESDARWLSSALAPGASTKPGAGKPVLLVLHHYPLDVAPYRWKEGPVEVPMEIPGADRARLWTAARAAGVRLVLCGHLHRARLEWHDGIAVGLQGQSGAAWAGRTISWYRVGVNDVAVEIERTA